MNRTQVTGLAVTAFAATSLAAGCTGSSGASSHTEQAKAAEASASASWNAPANRNVRQATRTTEKKAQACASTAQFKGSALGITAVLPQPFSGQKPKVSNIPFRAERHPVLAVEAIGGCMGYTEAAIRACAEQATPSSIHIHGLFGETLVKFSTCLSTKTVQPTPSAS